VTLDEPGDARVRFTREGAAASTDAVPWLPPYIETSVGEDRLRSILTGSGR